MNTFCPQTIKKAIFSVGMPVSFLGALGNTSEPQGVSPAGSPGEPRETQRRSREAQGSPKGPERHPQGPWVWRSRESDPRPWAPEAASRKPTFEGAEPPSHTIMFYVRALCLARFVQEKSGWGW